MENKTLQAFEEAIDKRVMPDYDGILHGVDDAAIACYAIHKTFLSIL